jgi:uncharacterized protein YcbX
MGGNFGQADSGRRGEEGSFFGQNLTHANEGVISIGDPVMIDHMAPEPNIAFRDAG